MCSASGFPSSYVPTALCCALNLVPPDSVSREGAPARLIAGMFLSGGKNEDLSSGYSSCHLKDGKLS